MHAIVVLRKALSAFNVNSRGGSGDDDDDEV